MSPPLTPILQTFYDQSLPHVPAEHHPALHDLTTFFNPFLESPAATISTYISTHPIEFTIIILTLLLLVNPLTLAGFAARGVSISSSAATWQSTMGGHVASGSLFSVLQSIGAKHSITIPAVAGTAAVLVAGRLGADEMVREVAWRAGEELGKIDGQKVFQQVVRGAEDGWKKFGGEEAVRQVVEKAKGELKALEFERIFGGLVGEARLRVGEVEEVAKGLRGAFAGWRANL